VLFVVAPPLVRAMFRLRATRASTAGTSISGGWSA
jgi:hypothetical protein